MLFFDLFVPSPETASPPFLPFLFGFGVLSNVGLVCVVFCIAFQSIESIRVGLGAIVLEVLVHLRLCAHGHPDWEDDP